MPERRSRSRTPVCSFRDAKSRHNAPCSPDRAEAGSSTDRAARRRVSCARAGARRVSSRTRAACGCPMAGRRCAGRTLSAVEVTRRATALSVRHVITTAYRLVPRQSVADELSQQAMRRTPHRLERAIDEQVAHDRHLQRLIAGRALDDELGQQLKGDEADRRIGRRRAERRQHLRGQYRQRVSRVPPSAAERLPRRVARPHPGLPDPSEAGKAPRR